ncbi:uncharacterized protein LOC143296993 [Babylonia areolata]|uniref:uncharacterized protein LOC143296993 n=1 Tax=Babylonia areolata TaxID=304850 RepID=UPI003FCF0797
MTTARLAPLTPLTPSRRGRVAWPQHHHTTPTHHHTTPTHHHTSPTHHDASLHPEVGPATSSLAASSRQHPHPKQPGPQSLPRKELRRLHRQRRALQASMLAYAHRMREISHVRHSANSPALRSTQNPGEARSEGGGSVHGQGRWQRSSGEEDRTQSGVTTTTTGQRGPRRAVTGHDLGDDRQTGPRPRISVDSGVDVTEAWVEGQGGVTHRRSLPALPSSPSLQSGHVPRPASFHVTADHEHHPQHLQQNQSDGVTGVKPRPASFHVTGKSREEPVPHATRQRRAGTSQNPNVLFHELSAQRSQQSGGINEDSLDSLSPFPAHEYDALPSISPFPQIDDEAKLEAEAVKRTPGRSVEKKTPAQVPSPLPLSPSKLKRTKQQYRSLKKVQTEGRFSVRTSKPVTKNLRQPLSSLSPRQASFRGSRKTRAAAKPQVSSRETFHHSFRYSDAVESLLKSFEACAVDIVDPRHIRKAAELLPTLDIEDLRQERTQKQKRRSVNRHLKRQTSSVNNPVTSDDVNGEGTDDDTNDGSDVRSDYGSDDGSVESFVSSEGRASEEGMVTGAAGEAEEPVSSTDTVLSEEEEGEEEGEGEWGGGGSDGVSTDSTSQRKTRRVSFCLPPSTLTLN